MTPEEKGPGPVGQGEYLVGEGECVASIAKDKGYFWETIWNDGANSELRNVRKNPNVLLPGDRVTLPRKNQKQDSGATEMRHKFVRKGEPANLVLRIMVWPASVEKSDDAEGAASPCGEHSGETTSAPREKVPMASTPYVLEVDQTPYEGTTDGDGILRQAIPGNARRAKLRAEWGGQALEFDLRLGGVNPIEEVVGVQQRLNNLGFDSGAADGIIGPITRAALRRFQAHYELEKSGKADQATRSKLVEAHGS